MASRNKGLSTWQQNNRAVMAYVVYVLPRHHIFNVYT